MTVSKQAKSPKQRLGALSWALKPVAQVTRWNAEEQRHVPHLFEVNPEETIESLWARVQDSLESAGQHDAITLLFMTTLDLHQRNGRYSPPEDQRRDVADTLKEAVDRLNREGIRVDVNTSDRDAWVRTAFLAWSNAQALGDTKMTFPEYLNHIGFDDGGQHGS